MVDGNPQAIEERIRQRAYRLWQDAGAPEGHADDYWHQAVRQIAAEGEDTPANGAVPHPSVEQSDKQRMEAPVPEESATGDGATNSAPRAKRRRG